MNRAQQGWIVVLLMAAAVFFYQGGEILAQHSDWADFRSPAGVGEVFTLLAAVIGAVAAALKIDLPNLLAFLKNGKGTQP